MNSKKLSLLIAQRSELLQQVRLANFAFAYQTLREFSVRIARGQLRGKVTLTPIDPDEERFMVTLTAHEMPQSRIEEHFSDEDLALFADVMGFATGHPEHELMFHIDQLGEFVSALRGDLERSGIEIDDAPLPLAERRLP